jgi:hypothetical protein
MQPLLSMEYTQAVAAVDVDREPDKLSLAARALKR